MARILVVTLKEQFQSEGDGASQGPCRMKTRNETQRRGRQNKDGKGTAETKALVKEWPRQVGTLSVDLLRTTVHAWQTKRSTIRAPETSQLLTVPNDMPLRSAMAGTLGDATSQPRPLISITR
eukprot:3490475-Pleurochrysis_carterae.AAC.1